MDVDVSVLGMMFINVVSAALILVVGWFAGGWVSNKIHDLKRLDGTLRSFLAGICKYAILVVAIVSVLQKFGVETASLLAILGAAGLAIGLALQGTLSNVASGVMLLFLRPFNVGDFIEGPSISGTVKSLGLFGCELARADNVYIFVPNSQIWNNQITNYSRNLHRRQDLVFGISYGDDINKAFKTIEKTINKDERLITTSGKEPMIMVGALGASSVDITARVWSNTSDFWAVKWDLTKAVKEALDKDGITIPFPTRTLEISKGDLEAATATKPKTKAKAA